MSEQRPDPEKLLQQVQAEERKEKRGKLKIYLGAAPGVGKTHEMLEDALEEHAKGLDLVVGIVESHGRIEIEKLLRNFDLLPRVVIDYQDKHFYEFDLEAALKRNPGHILVDEMAHTNVPGLRHRKRWQDIKELLERGIDVSTTLNVQHIESLNDNVSQIIHAPIKETIPDFMLEIADSIELVDLPPEDLLNRLKEGKVYISQQAELAKEHFFQIGNLTALRELALRVTAEHVGEQVLLYRQKRGIKYIWPTKEKILVCVGTRDDSLKLIRAARRFAVGLKAEWIAVYVDTPSIQDPEENRNRAIKNLRFAEQLGGETHILVGFDIVKEVLSFAHEKNVTQIMIWKHIRTRWRDLFMRNLADEMVRNSGEIDIYIMTGQPAPKKSVETVNPKTSFPWHIYGIALGIIALITAINFMLYPFLASSNLMMMYLLGVTIVALYGQIGPSVFASILSVLIYAICFTPYYFPELDIEYFFTLIVMLIVSQVISHLTILIQRQMISARLIEKQTFALYTLSRQLANTRGTDQLLEVGVRYIAQIFDSEVIALLPEKNELVIKTNPHKIQLNDKEKSIAQWVYDMGQMAGLSTDTLPFSDAIYVPLHGSEQVIGVLRIRPTHSDPFTAPDQLRLLESCSNQIALALEVDRLSLHRSDDKHGI